MKIDVVKRWTKKNERPSGGWSSGPCSGSWSFSYSVSLFLFSKDPKNLTPSNCLLSLIMTSTIFHRRIKNLRETRMKNQDNKEKHEFWCKNCFKIIPGELIGENQKGMAECPSCVFILFGCKWRWRENGWRLWRMLRLIRFIRERIEGFTDGLLSSR